MRKTPLPCFFFTSTTPPLLDFFFVPSLAFSTLHFCVKYTDAQDRLDFVFPTSLRHIPPPPGPCSTSLRHHPPFPIDLFYFTIPPDLLFFTNLRHTLLHFKSTPPQHPPPPTPPPPILSSLCRSGISSYIFCVSKPTDPHLFLLHPRTSDFPPISSPI